MVGWNRRFHVPIKRAKFRKNRAQHIEQIIDRDKRVSKMYNDWRDAMLTLFKLPNRDCYEVQMVGKKKYKIVRISMEQIQHED